MVDVNESSRLHKKSVQIVAPVLSNNNLTQPTTSESRMDFSPRKWLVGPAVFLYIAAYFTAFSTIIQYVYIRIQKDNYPNVTFNSSVSLCEVNTSDPDYKRQVESQEEASKWQMYFALFGGVPSVFANAILGCYTDRFGRKFLFFLPCIGSFIRLTVTTLGIYTGFPLLYFCIGYFVEGLTGSMFTLLLSSFTYIADNTPPGKQRSFGIVMIELAIGLGVTGFSFATGYFIQNTGFFYPMATSIGLVVASFVAIIFMPESYPKEKRRVPVSRFENIKDGFDLFFGSSNKGRRWMYNVTLLVFFLTMFTVFGRGGVESLYQMDSPFCWDPEKLGWFVALRSGLQQVVGMGLVKIFQKLLSDEAIALVGCLSYAGSYAMEGLAKTGLVIYLAAVVGACGLLTIPMVRANLSKMTPPDKQGAVFACISATEALCNLVSSVGSTAIYSNTVSFFPGFVFFVFVLCNTCSCVLMGIFIYGTRGKNTAYMILN